MTHVRTSIGLLMAVALVGLLAAVSGGAEGPLLMVSGKIASVDPNQNMVKLKTGLFATKEFVIEPGTTKITDGQQPLELGQLQPGAKATVEYVQGEEGTPVAQTITVELAAGGPEAPLPPEAPQAPLGPAPSQDLSAPGESPEAPAPSQPPGGSEPQGEPESQEVPPQDSGQPPSQQF